MRTRDRLARIERQIVLSPPADQAELFDLAAFMTFGELCVGQRALVRHGHDAMAALADEAFAACITVARLRRQGVAVVPLFGEAA